MAATYAKDTAPFNFLGTLTESQKLAFETWVAKHKANFTPISEFHRIRAHQLRKTSGLLEEFYKSKDPLARGLTPTFRKDAWNPGGEYFQNTARDDQGPANAMFEIKDRFEPQLALDDEANFRMNLLRVRFESQEDLAQDTAEGVALVEAKLKELTQCFADPHYRGACVRASDTYKEEPRFRVHPLDPPTAWEKRGAD